MPLTRLPLPLWIGFRYLRAKRRNQFISFLSIFSLLGMAFGSFALVVVLSVMNGFDDQIKRRILSVVPHGFVSADGGVNDWATLREAVNQVDGIEDSAPYIKDFGLVSQGFGIQGVEVQGIDPALEGSVSDVANKLIVGQLEDLRPGEFGIVIGRLLARYLGVTIGDKIVMVLPQISITPAGAFPRQKRLTIVGVFEVGAKQDQNLVLINLSDAQRLYRRTRAADGLRVRTSDLYQAGFILQNGEHQLSQAGFSQLTVLDWSETQGGLFRAVKMEKIVVACLLMIIVAVAAFNIVTSLVLMVADKRSNIAVLRTLGMTPGQIMVIFVAQGSIVGVLGIAVGCLLGSLVGVYIGDITSWVEQLFGVQVFDPNVYFVSKLPSVWELSDTAWVAVAGVILSVLASLYPAYQAAKVQPADALRYE